MRNLLAGLGGSSGAIAAGAACVALLVAGYWVQSGRSPDLPEGVVPVSKPAPAVTETDETPKSDPVGETAEASEEPQQAEAGETAVEVPVETAEEAAPVPAPAFDEVRREADGVTVIAGQGAPGADVRVMQNGTEIARVTADGTGKFATIALIPPDGQGHVLSLLQSIDGTETPSDGEIILTPLAAPVQVAEAAPVPEVETAEAVEEAAVGPNVETDTVSVEAEANPEPAVALNEAAAKDEPTETAGSQELAQAPETNDSADVAEPVETATVTSDDALDVSSPAAPTETALADTDQSAAKAEAGQPVAESQQPTSETTAAVTPDPQPVETASATQAPAPVETPQPATAVAVLKSTSEGVELLNTPAPEVMQNVAIDTISYSEGGDVQLAGRAQSEATTVRVYLDNAPVVSLSVDAEGRWRGDLPNVDEGIYTLRVDEVAADGAVTSRVETPFKREDPAVLAAATTGPDGPIKAVTVQEGATLWAIARERYGDGLLYVRVFEANRDAIRDPDLIYPGQIFNLPE